MFTKPKRPNKQYAFSVAGDRLTTEKVARNTAETISHFARRPVFWGEELINEQYMLNTPIA